MDKASVIMGNNEALYAGEGLPYSERDQNWIESGLPILEPPKRSNTVSYRSRSTGGNDEQRFSMTLGLYDLHHQPFHRLAQDILNLSATCFLLRRLKSRLLISGARSRHPQYLRALPPTKAPWRDDAATNCIFELFPCCFLQEEIRALFSS